MGVMGAMETTEMSSDTLPPEVLDNVMRCGCLGCKGMRMLSTRIAKAEFDSGFEARMECLKVCDCVTCAYRMRE